MKQKMFTCLFGLLLVTAMGALLLLLSAEEGAAVAAAAKPAATEAKQPVASGPNDSKQAKWTAPDQEAARVRAAETVPFVDTVVDECLLCGPESSVAEASEVIRELKARDRVSWLAPEEGPAASTLAGLASLDHYPALVTAGDHALLSPAILDEFFAGVDGRDVTC